MIEPDEEQLAILVSTARFNAIDGNAGAAKTTTLALKVLDALRHGMVPEDILVLTYSPAAVLAFQQRLRWIGVERETVLRVHITTFDDGPPSATGTTVGDGGGYGGFYCFALTP